MNKAFFAILSRKPNHCNENIIILTIPRRQTNRQTVEEMWLYLRDSKLDCSVYSVIPNTNETRIIKNIAGQRTHCMSNRSKTSAQTESEVKSTL